MTSVTSATDDAMFIIRAVLGILDVLGLAFFITVSHGDRKM